MNRFGTWISIGLAGVVLHVAQVVQAQAATPPATSGAAPKPVAADKPVAGAPNDEEDVEITAVPAAPATATAPEAARSSSVPAATSVPASSNSPSTSAPPSEAAAPSATAPTQPLAATKTAEQLRIEALEARLAAVEQAQQPSAKVDTPRDKTKHDDLFGFQLSGYLQAQYEASQLSEDQLQQGGLPQNRDRFLVRRARVGIERSWQNAGLRVELDGNTNRSVAVGLRRAEAAVFWPSPEVGAVPYLKATFGLQDIPFGLELPAGARQRIFMERSLASQAFFPNEPDIGVSFSGGVGPIRYALAVLNGQVADSALLSAVDPNAAKDVIARVGVDTKPESWFSITGGVSALEGRGFHSGGDATKNGLQWNDTNEDSAKSDAEVVGVPGSAATPAKNFERWAVAADVAFGLRTILGWSRLSAELTFANNLDRGLFVADPIASSAAVRELGYYVGFVQELTRYGLIGFRADYYDANSDLVDQRRGRVVPASQSIHTYSPVIGLVLPERARLLLQYDFVVDSLARDRRGVPTDLRNDQWTLRLQMGL